MAPRVPDTPYQSHVSIGAKALKEMIEHFPAARGPKSDPQLIWHFEDLDVRVKSFEATMDSKGPFCLSCLRIRSSTHICFAGKGQLATELTLPAEEFHVYNVHAPPCTIAFHLREFNVSRLDPLQLILTHD